MIVRVTLALLFLSLTSLSAQEIKSITLSGDHIEYDRTSSNITASGNVKLKLRDFVIHTKKISYDIQDEHIQIPATFNINQDGKSIGAKNFDYKFKSFQGSASSVNVQIERVHIVGEKLDFNPLNITIDHAAFTTCDADHPHYLIRSDKIYLYPALGVIVAFQNYFTLFGTPIFWFPTYVYGSRSYRLIATNTPIPEIGSNNREGLFIKERLGYFLNGNSTGTFDFGYAQNLGWLAGINHGLNINDLHQLQLKAYSLGSDGFAGGAAYQLTARTTSEPRPKDALETLFSPFTDSPLPLSRFTVRYLLKELVNESRVDYKPEFQSEFNNIRVPYTGLKLNSNISAGLLEEETPLKTIYKSSRININGDLSEQYHLTDSLHGDASLIYLGYWFSSDQQWQRLFSRLRLIWDTPILTPEISYTNRIFNNGRSPFEFERLYAIETDEIGLKLTHKNADWSASADMDYNLEARTPRRLDFITSFNMHCIQASLIWKSVERQFLLGISLY